MATLSSFRANSCPMQFLKKESNVEVIKARHEVLFIICGLLFYFRISVFGLFKYPKEYGYTCTWGSFIHICYFDFKSILKIMVVSWLPKNSVS